MHACEAVIAILLLDHVLDGSIFKAKVDHVGHVDKEARFQHTRQLEDDVIHLGPVDLSNFWLRFALLEVPVENEISIVSHNRPGLLLCHAQKSSTSEAFLRERGREKKQLKKAILLMTQPKPPRFLLFSLAQATKDQDTREEGLVINPSSSNHTQHMGLALKEQSAALTALGPRLWKGGSSGAENGF